MASRLRKIVLILLVLVAVASPYMQLDSWDRFPAATDDIELQLILNLCIIGMFFAFAGVVIQLFPAFFRFPFSLPTGGSMLHEMETVTLDFTFLGFSPPLRN